MPCSYMLRYISLFFPPETAILPKEISRNWGHCWKINQGGSSVAGVYDSLITSCKIQVMIGGSNKSGSEFESENSHQLY